VETCLKVDIGLAEAKVYQIDLGSILVSDQNVFQLDVIMHPSKGMQVLDSFDLRGLDLIQSLPAELRSEIQKPLRNVFWVMPPRDA
jgi:hypothetical protein